MNHDAGTGLRDFCVMLGIIVVLCIGFLVVTNANKRSSSRLPSHYSSIITSDDVPKLLEGMRNAEQQHQLQRMENKLDSIQFEQDIERIKRATR